jgi:hypothetical protein
MSNCLDLQRREADPKYEENIGEEKKKLIKFTSYNPLFDILKCSV